MTWLSLCETDGVRDCDCDALWVCEALCVRLGDCVEDGVAVCERLCVWLLD
jgi:hypothetical protein